MLPRGLGTDDQQGKRNSEIVTRNYRNVVGTYMARELQVVGQQLGVPWRSVCTLYSIFVEGNKMIAKHGMCIERLEFL